jgi:methyl-accepting chemotaxis protein
MSRLYLRIGFGVLVACIVDIIVIFIPLNQIQRRDRQGFHEMILGQGLGWMQHQFDESDRDKWPAMLRVARKKSSAALDILTAVDARRRADTSLSTSKPTFTGHPLAPPRVYLPLKNGSYYLIVGPSPPPRPPNDFLLLPIVFIVILTIIAAVIVGLPLTRRLTNLRRAINELGQGNWNIRLDAESEGALREVAECLNQTATRLHELFQERETLLQAVSHEIGTPLARMRFQL